MRRERRDIKGSRMRPPRVPREPPVLRRAGPGRDHWWGSVCDGEPVQSEAHVTSQTGPAEFAELTEPLGAGPVSIETRRWLDGAAVERPVLELRPDYTALIVVAEGLRPGPSDEASDALLRDAEAQAQAALGGRDPGELAPVAAWRAAYQAFGAKPKRTRPSVEALLRRVEAGLPRI